MHKHSFLILHGVKRREGKGHAAVEGAWQIAHGSEEREEKMSVRQQEGEAHGDKKDERTAIGRRSTGRW
ncbi:hypothetical protein AMTR_s00017p00104270 [Amborella trichopoda]|uniref:Uncharacterized protein n=1 Tax=Amborella trichopoda TaxID=13333 RepID=W1PF02_AMBTC|nr:hypothetical protein AMTR_s00017p00104270 [Amborella trichopoda]